MSYPSKKRNGKEICPFLGLLEGSKFLVGFFCQPVICGGNANTKGERSSPTSAASSERSELFTGFGFLILVVNQ